MIGIIILLFIMALLGVGGYLGFNYLKKTVNSDEEKEKYIPTTIDNLPFDWIRRGVVKMKNGSYCKVVKLPTINIDLMEGDEREVVFSQYRQILSSIDFPFQYLQQSRIVDVADYIKKLEKIQRNTPSQFIHFQLEHYKRYINSLVSSRSILTRKFYLVVPYDEVKEKKAKSSGNMFDISVNKKSNAQKNAEKETVMEEEKKFEMAYKELQSRVDLIIRSFSRFDIHPEELNDEELTELYYTSYNKNKSVHQPLRANELKENEYYNLYVKREGEKRENR